MNRDVRQIYKLFCGNPRITCDADGRITILNNKSLLSFVPFSKNGSRETQLIEKYWIRFK